MGAAWFRIKPTSVGRDAGLRLFGISKPTTIATLGQQVIMQVLPNPNDQPMLVVVPSIPAARDGDALFLDDKAVSGLRLYSRYWEGPVRAIFREGAASNIVFGKR